MGSDTAHKKKVGYLQLFITELSEVLKNVFKILSF